MNTTLKEKAGGKDEAFGVVEVKLTNFRNYDSALIALGSEFNILAGPNGHGKTNFLEALYLISTTQMLRGQRDGEGIRDGAHEARVEVTTDPHATGLSVVLVAGVRKRAAINGVHLPRASDLLGRLPCVCLTSQDLEIVRGEPSARRQFLDLDLSSRFPAYLNHLTHYKRAIEQRNSLLKLAQESHVTTESFEVWEEPLAEHGAAIRRLRGDYLTALQPLAQDIHERMGSGERLALQSEPKEPLYEASELRERFVRERPIEIRRGTTSVGPHRDDFKIEIDGRDARYFGSQGQQRTAMIAIKFGSLLAATDVLGAKPLLLLDDMLSDLDVSRRQALVDVIVDHAGQAVLTCTEAEAAGEAILQRARLFHVNKGTIRT